MNIGNINSIKERNIVFEGKRTDRNAVKQLAKNNRYSLTEPNQRYISTAIENLGQVKGSKNINFLLDTAAKNTYKTNIVLKNAPKNNWTAKLLAAAAAAIALTPFVSKQIKEKLAALSQPQDLNEVEIQILELRKQLLELVNLEQIEKETKGTMKEFEKNLDYFIVSSETTLAHKKYVLERLNYFMSDEYEINPQLVDKKSIVIAEMVNDMAIHVPGNKIPNIKAVDQRQHGMCAAISIVRKKLAYEDKPNYVDSIISELDASPFLSVYDRNELGSNKRTQVRKVPVDFTTALERGYRIIDASTMHWMQVAHMTGKNDIALSEYTPFDKKNFDVMADSFYNVKMSDEGLARTQAYYQSLLQAKSVIEKYKAASIKRDLRNEQANANFDENIELMGRTTSLIKEKIFSLNPNISKEETQELLSSLMGLEKKSSEFIKKDDKYSYIANEEVSVIKERVKKYILDNSSIQQIDDKTFDSIFDLMNYYKSLDAQTKLIKPAKNPIRKAQQLYEVGAAFRYQVITGLQEPETLKSSMMINGIVDEDTLIVETIDTLIERLNNNSSDSNLIIEQLAPQVLEFGEANKHNTIEWLSALKEATQTVLTESLDTIYASMALGSRKQVLYNTIENLKYVAITADKATLENLSELLGTKKTNEDIIDKLDTMQERVANGDEKDYIEVLNTLGNKSQMELVANGLRALVERINSEESGETLNAFLAANGIENAENPNDFVAQLQLIEDMINNVNNVLREYASALKIVDKDGDVLYSANPQDIIIKKMENKNQIPSAKALRELQEHFDKVTKNRRQDEFGRAGKLTDKSLLKFSNREKQTIKNLEESINPMLAYIHKQLDAVQKSEFKESLEELNRIIGVNTGAYWVFEGGSGLSDNSQIRVLEYMTGRPHYKTSDWKEAVEKIKASPYSAIGTMIVSHRDSGAHAQYIADITPTEIEVKDKDGNVKKETVDILYHDNTWGPAEKENTWVDSQGLMRTDYDREYGGTLGYITNEKMLNGNKVSRITGEMLFTKEADTTNNKVYKRIKHNDPLATPYIRSQYIDAILDGSSPDAKSLANQIHDLMFMPNTENIDDLEKNVKDKIAKIKAENPNANVSEEISAMITSLELSGKSWKSTYENLKQRIFATSKDVIKTKADYDKLANNDYLKVVLEKIAIKQNYQLYGRESELAMVRDVKDLEKFKASQKARAMNAFKYAFSKTTPILDFLSKEMNVIQEFDIQKILEKHGIELTLEESMLIAEVFDIPKDKFTGSARDTINYLMNAWAEDIDKLITKPEANKEIKDYLHKFLEKNLYFTKKDIDTKRLEHLVKFIDREFDPIDDNEFVKTFNRIQDMTMEEFKKEILPKVKSEDLGIKDLTGYEVLKKIQFYDEDMNKNLINTVFHDSLVPEINPQEVGFKYIPKRFYRTTGMNLNDQDFNTLYRMISNDISLLTLPKLFNKYKDDGITRVNAYPAYPKLDYLSDEVISTSFDSIIHTMSNNIEVVKAAKDQIENYSLNHRLMNYMNKLESTHVLTDYQYKNLNLILGTLITLNLADDTIDDVVNAAADLMDIPKGTPWSEYLPNMTIVTEAFNKFEATTSKQHLQKTMDNSELFVKAGIKGFVGSQIQERYRGKITRYFNELKQAFIENNEMEIERLKNILRAEIELSHILQNPEELLQSYVKSIAEESPLHPYNEAYKVYLTRCVQYATLAEMQELMMQALDEGVTPSVRKMFSTFTIELKDDLPASMNSAKIISLMVHKLILDGQLETAQMFVEKFGLGDTYVEFMNKQIDFNSMKEILKEAYDVSKDFSQFQATLDPFFNEAGELLKIENVDYIKLMNELKKAVKAVGKANNIDNKDIKVLLQSLDLVKDNIANTPNGDPVLLYNAIMNPAKAQVVNSLQQKLDMANDVIKSNATIFELLEKIELKPGKIANMRDELLNKFGDLVAYKNELINLQQGENSATI